jgi:hypothetical protein
MPSSSDPLIRGFSASLQEFAQRVHTLAGPLTEEQFWRKPYGYGNSFGHLTLHLTGNLNYYIGARIAGTGYVRDRDREFTDPNPPSKAEALRRFDDAILMAVRTIGTQTDADWSRPYEAVGAAMCPDRFSIVLRCTAHVFHHVGQMIYLAKEYAARAALSRPLSNDAADSALPPGGKGVG